MALTAFQRIVCRLVAENRFRSGAVLVTVVLGQSLSLPATRAEEEDGLPHAFEAGWKGEAVCEVLSEDEAVWIGRCRFPPGVGHERHFHNPHFGYVLAGGTMRIEGPDGVETVETRAGSSWSSDEVTVHAVLNVGDTTASYLIVEPKEPAPAKTRQLLPAQSPVATVSQRIGYADVEIRYSRPRVRGREIWDALVPYGEVWRTGADYPTFFEVSEAIRVEGEGLPAGRYALYTIPGAETWTVLFSRETELWGAFGYEPSADALRVEVEPRPAPAFTESFTIEVADVTMASALLVLRWADLEVPIRLESEVLERVVAAVAAAEPDDWGVPWRGAVALMEIGERPELAAEWMERSLAVERNWMNLWTAALLAAAAGESERAVALGEEALATCEAASQYCPYSASYATQVERWRKQEPGNGSEGPR